MDNQTRNLLNELVVESGITDIIESYTQDLNKYQIFIILMENIDYELKYNKTTVSIKYIYNDIELYIEYKSLLPFSYYESKNKIYHFRDLISLYYGYYNEEPLLFKIEMLRAKYFLEKVFKDLELTENEINKMKRFMLK